LFRGQVSLISVRDPVFDSRAIKPGVEGPARGLWDRNGPGPGPHIVGWGPRRQKRHLNRFSVAGEHPVFSGPKFVPRPEIPADGPADSIVRDPAVHRFNVARRGPAMGFPSAGKHCGLVRPPRARWPKSPEKTGFAVPEKKSGAGPAGPGVFWDIRGSGFCPVGGLRPRRLFSGLRRRCFLAGGGSRKFSETPKKTQIAWRAGLKIKTLNALAKFPQNVPGPRPLEKTPRQPVPCFAVWPPRPAAVRARIGKTRFIGRAGPGIAGPVRGANPAERADWHPADSQGFAALSGPVRAPKKKREMPT